MAKKLIEYNGQKYTLKELSAMHGVSISTINGRLRQGWDIHEAVTTPPPVKREIQRLPAEFADGNIVEVVFKSPLGGVFSHMQPVLGRKYVCTAHATVCMAPCFTITLENGKILIVYREEFDIVNVIPPTPALDLFEGTLMESVPVACSV